MIALKGDTPEYVRRMQPELFEAIAPARSREELSIVEPMAKEVRDSYMDGLENTDVKDLAIHRKVSRVSYSQRCADGSAVQEYQKRGLPLALGMRMQPNGKLMRGEIWAIGCSYYKLHRKKGLSYNRRNDRYNSYWSY